MANFQAFRIHNDDGQHHAGIEEMPLGEPAAGEVLIRACFSSINYKDALAGTGKGRILRRFPLTGGIDVAGKVAASRDPRFAEGDDVLATGYGLGVESDGGYGDYARVPADWVVALPEALGPFEAMALGTAGFTAALALHRMEQNGQRPELGPVLVTGASGGVGCIALNILNTRGYETAAVSAKAELREFLRSLGASRIIDRDELPAGERPLEQALWGGAIDSVGGAMLARLTRTTKPWGNIASIGLAGGVDLNTTVMPFILRGISLLGIDSVNCPHELRTELWQRLASDMHPRNLEDIVDRTVGLDDLPGVFERMLRGESHGRTVVKLAGWT